MPVAEHQVLIEAARERVFAVIVDYERYPEFLPEIRQVTLASRDDGVAVVSFEVELIVRVHYTLRLIEDPYDRVTWSLAAAQMLEKNDGRWTLEEVGATTTRVSYGLDVKLAGMIPKSVSTRLLGTTLPQMLDRFKARAESVLTGPGGLTKSTAPKRP